MPYRQAFLTDPNYYLVTDALGNVVDIKSANGNLAGMATLDKTTGEGKYAGVPDTSIAASRLFEKVLRDDYGADLSGASDAKTALQYALDAVAAKYPGAVVLLPPAAALKLLSGVTVDAALHAIDFNGLIAKPVGAMNVVTITGSDTAYGLEANNMNFMRRLHIDGDLTSGQVGLYTHRAANANNNGPSRFGLERITVRQCDVAEKVGSNSYGQDHYACNFVENNVGIWSPAGATNSYELPKWISCWIANNVLGIQGDEGQLTFEACHIDYNRKQGTSAAARLLFIGCHIESNLTRDTYIAGQTAWDISGTGSFVMQGGRMIFTPGTSGNNLDYIFNVTTGANYEGGVFIDRATLERCAPASGYMAKGVGNCYVTRCLAKATTPMPKGVHETQNKLDSGGFEAALFPTDNVFVSAGGGNTSRIASANVTISQSATAVRSGTNGLLITKNTAAGASGTADVCIWADLDDTSCMHTGRLWFKAPSSTAQVTIQFGYFAAMPKVAGSDIYWSPVDTDTMTVTPAQPATLSTTWTEVTVPIPYRRPKPGMRFVGFRIRVHALGAAETMFVDDVEIHAF